MKHQHITTYYINIAHIRIKFKDDLILYILIEQSPKSKISDINVIFKLFFQFFYELDHLALYSCTLIV